MASEMTSSEVISNANMGDMCNIFKHLVTWAHQDPVLPRCHRSPSLPQSLMTCTVTNTTDTLCTTNTRQEHHTSQEVALKVSALNSITSQLSHQSMLSKRGVNLHHWHPAAIVFFCWAIAAASRPTMPSWPPYSLNIKAHAKNTSVWVREWFYGWIRLGIWVLVLSNTARRRSMYAESDLQLSLGSYSLGSYICAKAQKETTVNLLL